MKKIMLMVVLLLLAGCTSQVRTLPFATDYRQGIGGLTLESISGLPPNEIYEGGNFKIALRLKNTGAYEIKRGSLEIAGLDERYVALEKKKVELKPIEGKSITNPEGGFYIEEFGGRTLRALEKAKEYTAVYHMIAQYDYRTEAQTQVCVNTNLYSDLKLTQESCKPATISLSGQGAPMVITKIEESIMPKEAGAELVFKLYIENKGKGQPLGLVYVEEVKLANRRLSCEKTSLEFKKDQENAIVCKIDENEAGNYVTPFYAAIYYTYKIDEKKEFKIRSLQG